MALNGRFIENLESLFAVVDRIEASYTTLQKNESPATSYFEQGVSGELVSGYM